MAKGSLLILSQAAARRMQCTIGDKNAGNTAESDIQQERKDTPAEASVTGHIPTVDTARTPCRFRLSGIELTHVSRRQRDMGHPKDPATSTAWLAGQQCDSAGDEDSGDPAAAVHFFVKKPFGGESVSDEGERRGGRGYQAYITPTKRKQ